MGACHHSQETMATVLDKLQETLCLQEEQYLGFREELRTIGSDLGTIVGVLKDIQQTLRDTVCRRLDWLVESRAEVISRRKDANKPCYTQIVRLAFLDAAGAQEGPGGRKMDLQREGTSSKTKSPQ
ncbi:hypothetical protein NDU88_004043 [Pleurodeles waltl]|uniref:Uncharacterized protein n=1 Tax=Pleurodeles waltl TaxID=8319 RepID=A0AAV7MTR3_PLEWA|nr:hypothetical protein NDU88_004041 [Pleurodeles waltl]KAJ1106642.1 hypothetical protein NDU88_004043 [Pleurodeles waltl]